MDMTPTLLLHGIRSRHQGRRTMGGLRKKLRGLGIPVEIVSYGYIAMPVTNNIAVNTAMEAITKASRNGPGRVDVVGYSNGGNTALTCAELGAPIRHLHLISNPLPRTPYFPPHLETITVYFCPDDEVIRTGRVYAAAQRIFPWRWFSPHLYWQAQLGRRGYDGVDPRVENVQYNGVGHYYFQHEEAVAKTAQRIKKKRAND